MTKQEFIRRCNFTVINEGDNLNMKVETPFCCDLLSIAMSKIPVGAAWATVMGNINTIAVATLTEVACVILSEGVTIDAAALSKAKSEGVTILATDLPIFGAAYQVYQIIHDSSNL
ncbi:hypothetical protein [Lachnoclostridium phytofermentans]|uniref:DRTGG domain-containing protein n=1 Tax=Lachnoclostridium phytofermentans (strain ATCC 700394 / DSM 18823 / ISDg) TaxID=357809 RepID=A9KKF3_LACP7|nr:hypothetical protein [Lachnoclostridium phytofermentans]ABX44144.1 conserved hypothetical protein [Lachnoclostridium phytofermentans ISDg]